MVTINNDVRYLVCPLCRSSKIRRVGEITYASPTYFSSEEINLTHQAEYWKCQTCQSTFVQNVISESIAASLYTQGCASDRWSTLPFEQSKTKEVVECLANILLPQKSVLDVGCNTGEFLDFAKSKGCKTSGVEYSLNSLQRIVQKGHDGFQTLQNATGCYDLITAFDVVEHLYHLPDFITTCVEKLLPGGYLICLTGNPVSVSARLANSNWWYASYPEHIVFPSKTYFKNYSGLHITQWISTYAAPWYKHSVSKTFKLAITPLRNDTYTGSPSFGGDHVLVVLRKQE